MDAERGPWGDKWDVNNLDSAWQHIFALKEDLLARSPCAGRSLLGMMEARLDELVLALMMPTATAAQRGEALGVATCIAYVKTPYAPDVEAVRRMALQRFNDRVSAAQAAQRGFAQPAA